MKQYLSLLSTIAVSVMLAACSEQETSNNATSAATQPASSTSIGAASAVANNPDYPTYLVGSDLSYEPFEFKSENGVPTGFEVELLQAIGQKAKFNVTIIHAPRKELQETLDNGKYTIWASALSVSPERAEQMDLSDPFLSFVRTILVLDKPENANLKTLADLKGKKIAVNGSSKSAVTTAQELTGSADNVIKADSFYLSLATTYRGDTDGTLGDNRILQYYQTKQPDVQTRMISMGDAPKNIAFAVKKGNTEVLKQINEGLAAVKADGTYDKLVEKWFGKNSQ